MMEIEALGEYPPQCYFIYHKSHMTYLGSNPDRSGGKPAYKHLWCGTFIRFHFLPRSLRFDPLDSHQSRNIVGKILHMAEFWRVFQIMQSAVRKRIYET
jgi:hypothetical protein